VVLRKQDTLLAAARYITRSMKGDHIAIFNLNIFPRNLFTGFLFNFKYFLPLPVN